MDFEKEWEEWLDLTRRGNGRSPEGWKFNREEIYDRMVCGRPMNSYSNDEKR